MLRRIILNRARFQLAIAFCVLILSIAISSCGIYALNEKSNIKINAKTVKITTIENRAPYVNPQLSPNLTDKLRQKIASQTKLTSTNNDNADWEITGRIEDYSVSTAGVSTNANGQAQSSINRLTVRVHITVNKRLDNKVDEYDASRSFDFDARQSLQAAEANLIDEMTRNLTDEIFNKLFSDW